MFHSQLAQTLLQCTLSAHRFLEELFVPCVECTYGIGREVDVVEANYAHQAVKAVFVYLRPRLLRNRSLPPFCAVKVYLESAFELFLLCSDLFADECGE